MSFSHLQQHSHTLAQSLANYSDYLSSQNKIMKLHALILPVRQVSDALSIKFVKPSIGVPLAGLTVWLLLLINLRISNICFWMISLRLFGNERDESLFISRQQIQQIDLPADWAADISLKMFRNNAHHRARDNCVSHVFWRLIECSSLSVSFEQPWCWYNGEEICNVVLLW